MENNNENEELIQNPGNEENLIPEKKGCIQNKITIFSNFINSIKIIIKYLNNKS